MLKIDLGISHDLRDDYFNNLISSCNAELLLKGIIINAENTDDIMLLSDYAAWRYRKRIENTQISESLRRRILNRQIKRRSENA